MSTLQSIQARIKKLVSSECANHQSTGPWGVKDCCWLQEKLQAKINGASCIYFTAGIEIPRCDYFENCVLPLNEDLLADLDLEDEPKNEQIQVEQRCEVLDRYFVERSEIESFCEQQRPDFITCIKCKAGLSLKPQETRKEIAHGRSVIHRVGNREGVGGCEKGCGGFEASGDAIYQGKQNPKVLSAFRRPGLGSQESGVNQRGTVRKGLGMIPNHT